MKKNIRFKGFTLLETIIVCLLTFMILACVFTILVPIRNIYKDTYNAKDSMDVNDLVGKSIERDLRYANRIYVFDGFHTDDDTDFIQDCVDTFRSDFLFTTNPSYTGVKERIFGNKTLDDVVYVMKLDNRDSDADGTSRGYVSKYEFDAGTLNSVNSKINMVNPLLFDDRANNRGYTIDYTLGFDKSLENGINGKENSSEITEGVDAQTLRIVLTTYKSRLNDITLADKRSSVVAEFENTLAQQTVSFPLVNVAEAGKILWESISYEMDDGTKVTPQTINGTVSQSLIDVPRFRYYDYGNLPAAISSVDSGNDIYFVYTCVNIPE